MKHIPILFSTPMVNAILEGRKTMTRRVKGLAFINKCPDNWEVTCSPCESGGKYKGQSNTWQFGTRGIPNTNANYENVFLACPYGQIGDILWVRESFREYYNVDENGYTDFSKKIIKYGADNHEMIPQMDGDGREVFNKDGTEKYIPLKPSIFMPKTACRIFLKIVSVKVERLWDINVNDAFLEGIERLLMTRQQLIMEGQLYRDYSLLPQLLNNGLRRYDSFKSLWTKINGQESWDANPFVWVIEFEKTVKPENFI